MLNYMSTRIGEELDAVVTGVEDFGLFVQGLEIPAEGFIHISSPGRRLLRLRSRVAQFARAEHRPTVPPGRQSPRGDRGGRFGSPDDGFPNADRPTRAVHGQLADEAKNPPLEISRKPPKRGPGRFSGQNKKKGNGRR
ncbi:MAG: S1 RNA-binding domain-containing protein [Pirellulales bacterium]